ncbi:MAG: patatin-like phospholipase family protein [Bacteroidales bacterium]|nr:patatin-like phospholipase family protein [Bacteroidales bacterium]
MKKIALALGGGGARGLAHIGFLRVLEKENIPISRVSGCSMGAMIGGVYCLYKDVDKVEEEAYNFVNHPVFREFNFDDFAAMDKRADDWKSKALNVMGRIKVGLSLFKTLAHPSIYEADLVDQIYNNYPDAPIENLQIPFTATTNDILTGEEVIINKGSLRLAVRASSAIPGYLPPVKYENYLLVDGGVSNLVPTHCFRKNSDELIIGVDVSQPILESEEPKSGVNIIQRAESIREYHLVKLKTLNADKVIRCNLNGISWADFSSMDEIIKYGEKTAKKLMPWIKKNIE